MRVSGAKQAPVGPISVCFLSHGTEETLIFERSFRIGRLKQCEVCIKDDYVGRTHAEVFPERGTWWIRDLESKNGIFVNGDRIDCAEVTGHFVAQLGKDGPEIILSVTVKSKSDNTIDRYIQHYFGTTNGSDVLGEHTMKVRRAFAQVQRRQKFRYRRILALLAAAMAVLSAYALYENVQLHQQRTIARGLFYSIKSTDLDIANLQRTMASSATGAGAIRDYESRRREMQKSYDRLLTSLHVYNNNMTEQQRIMLRVTRLFGECELDMPRDFEDEIKKYIQKWHSSNRLNSAIGTAQKNGYVGVIYKELVDQGLPPQLFYLALQESGFDSGASGPVTRSGIAKGMWQFMPHTALAYGLRVGPLVELRQPDSRDERNDYRKETKAAAQYMKDLYSTDAQASGFLVMASYNWGENRVIPLIRRMPLNPRERNFWQLLKQHRSEIPQETYDYVFYIASAAVIGENPRLFGFDFDNPLSGYIDK
jgi:hypothetical protein